MLFIKMLMFTCWSELFLRLTLISKVLFRDWELTVYCILHTVDDVPSTPLSLPYIVTLSLLINLYK